MNAPPQRRVLALVRFPQVYDKFWHAGIPKWIRVKNGTVGGNSWQWQEDYLYKQAIGLADARVAAAATAKLQTAQSVVAST